MKRFIISVLFVSVFFIGLGTIIEKTSAKFKSDEKALEIINRARTAIGGDANLRNVNSMTIMANITHTLETPETQVLKGGTMEINLQFPGMFSKMVKIGNPDNANGEAEIVKNVDVIVMKKGEGETVDLKGVGEDGNKNVVVIRKDGGEIKSEDVRVEGNKVIVTKKDGTTEELKIDGNSPTEKVIVRKNSDNNGVFVDESGKTYILDGNSTFVPNNKMHAKHDNGMRNNEMLRTTIGLLLTAPQGLDVTYKYLGEGNVDGSTVNIIGVESMGDSFKLFIDASTNLPKMISFEGKQHRMIFVKKDDMPNMQKGEKMEFKVDMPNSESVETQIKFSDFRSVNGISLPHRWIESVGGKTMMTTDITSFEINPANIVDKFKDTKVFVRTGKSTENN